MHFTLCRKINKTENMTVFSYVYEVKVLIFSQLSNSPLQCKRLIKDLSNMTYFRFLMTSNVPQNTHRVLVRHFTYVRAFIKTLLKAINIAGT